MPISKAHGSHGACKETQGTPPSAVCCEHPFAGLFASLDATPSYQGDRLAFWGALCSPTHGPLHAVGDGELHLVLATILDVPLPLLDR